jgi:hypothetical protein
MMVLASKKCHNLNCKIKIQNSLSLQEVQILKRNQIMNMMKSITVIAGMQLLQVGPYEN